MAGLGSIAELEKHAESKLSSNAFAYFANGTDNQITLNENTAAFQRYKILPRFLRDVDCFEIDVSTTILGEKLSLPICASPTGLHKCAHQNGETETAKGCRAAGTCMAVSAFATCTYEEIADVCPDTLKWCQMYIFKDQGMTERFVRRAELNGYKALLVTVDTSPLKKRADFRKALRLGDTRTANFTEDSKSSGPNLKEQMDEINGFIKARLAWEDVRWLKSITKLPVVLKGILSAEDATEAVKNGVDGILVSNKGGRKLDVLPGTLEVLPSIARAVCGKIEIYLDGGVRNGVDVFKALALGARAVFIGRPVIWGLVHNGWEGVRDVFELMKEELKFIMANCGCGKISDINEKSLLRHYACQCKL